MFTFDNDTLKYFLQKLKDYFASKSEVNNKVDKIDGKSLSSNDYTDYYKSNLLSKFKDVELVKDKNNITLKFYKNSGSIHKVNWTCSSAVESIIITTMDKTTDIVEGDSITIPFVFASLNDGGGTLYVDITNAGETNQLTQTITDQGKDSIDLGVMELGTSEIQMYVIDSLGSKSNVINLTVNCQGESDKTIIQVSIPSDNYTLTLLSADDQVVGDGLIDWGDSSTSNVTNASSSTHTFASAGVYTIKGRFKFGGTAPSDSVKECLVKVKQLSDQTITMDNAFNGCSNLTVMETNLTNEIVLNGIENIFNGCSNLTKVDVSKFDTSNCTSMSNMFNECKELISIDLNSLNTNNIIDMQYIFNNCNKLIELDLNSFNTSRVTNMSYMFNGCIALSNLNVSNFETNLVTNMSYMFNGCNSLSILNLDNFDTNLVSNMSYMFNGCSSLTELSFNNSFVTSNVIDTNHMFNGCSSLISLDVSNFNTSNIENMNNMFNECSKISTLNLSSFNTTKVTDMSYMFNNCNKLTSLILGINFITSSVINMENIFAGCNKLIDIDLSNFNTNNVENMSRMFNGCSNLTSIDLGNFNTNKVTNMNSMFKDCTRLGDIDVSKFVTNTVTDMEDIFSGCSSLTQLDVSNFDCSNVINFGTFVSSSILTDLNPPTNIQTSITVSTDNLTHDSLLNLLNNLLVAVGQTVYIGTINAAKLSGDELKIATDKGWLIG